MTAGTFRDSSSDATDWAGDLDAPVIGAPSSSEKSGWQRG
jgi:hypothetical protein